MASVSLGRAVPKTHSAARNFPAPLRPTASAPQLRPPGIPPTRQKPRLKFRRADRNRIRGVEVSGATQGRAEYHQMRARQTAEFGKPPDLCEERSAERHAPQLPPERMQR